LIDKPDSVAKAFTLGQSFI